MQRLVRSKNNFTGLTISDRATLGVADGFQITLTVDGREAPIRSGAYKGNVVLEVVGI